MRSTGSTLLLLAVLSVVASTADAQPTSPEPVPEPAPAQPAVPRPVAEAEPSEPSEPVPSESPIVDAAVAVEAEPVDEAASEAPVEAASAESVNPFATNTEPEETTSRDELPPLETEERSWVQVSAPEAPLQPLRIIGRLGFGLGFRLNSRDAFQQSTLAPAYVAGLGGVVLPGRGRIRHQVTLGVNTNLNRDGTYPSGVGSFQQWTFTPSYGVRFALSDSPVPLALLIGRVGVPISVSPDVTLGGEVAVGAQVNLLAGLGVYAEVAYDFFFGGTIRNGDGTVHHILALELGVTIDFEVLP